MGRCLLQFQRFAKIAKPLQRLRLLAVPSRDDLKAKLEGKQGQIETAALWCWQGRRSTALIELQARSRFERSFTIPRFGSLWTLVWRLGVHSYFPSQPTKWRHRRPWMACYLWERCVWFYGLLDYHGNGPSQAQQLVSHRSTWPDWSRTPGTLFTTTLLLMKSNCRHFRP